MRCTRALLIDVFLWICPLTGIGVFVAMFLTGKVPPPPYGLPGAAYFDVPRARPIEVLAGLIVAPWIIACVTRRALGFVAGCSLLLMLMSGALWVRTLWVCDQIAFGKSIQHSDGPTLHDWRLISTGGGMGILVNRWRPASSPDSHPVLLLPPGRDSAIHYFADGYADRSLAEDALFSQTSNGLRRRGFAVAVKPPGEWFPPLGGLIFGMAVPYSFLCLLTATLPLAWSLRYRRRRRAARRAQAGQCVRCGYDLRATPDATGARLATCPECGAAAPARVTYGIAV